MIRYLLAVVAIVLTCALPANAQQSSVKVIVHASNPIGAVPMDEVSRIFLKRKTSWPSGAQVAPVDRDGRSNIRSSFARTFHDRSTDALDSYWQQQIFSGREAPPPVVTSDAETVEYVAKNPNAIGYVSATANLPATVRVLEVTAR